MQYNRPGVTTYCLELTLDKGGCLPQDLEQRPSGKLCSELYPLAPRSNDVEETEPGEVGHRPTILRDAGSPWGLGLECFQRVAIGNEGALLGDDTEQNTDLEGGILGLLKECILWRADPLVPIEDTIEYSPFTLDIEDPKIALLETCRELDIAVIAYSPLRRVTQRFADGFDAKDFRRTIERYNAINFPNILKITDGLVAIGKKYNATSSQVALAWLRVQGEDFIPIPGTTKIKRSASSLDAGAGKGERCPPEFSALLFSITPPLRRRDALLGVAFQSARVNKQHGCYVIGHDAPRDAVHATPRVVDESGCYMRKRLETTTPDRTVADAMLPIRLSVFSRRPSRRSDIQRIVRAAFDSELSVLSAAPNKGTE
ncbi:NADP-dependent oxidoreductase domain-containing protein [Mycena capillaripes]|nr:NADP-dependent oxidoreductase domain-containing protein [Mycena capillaripes]